MITSSDLVRSKHYDSALPAVCFASETYG